MKDFSPKALLKYVSKQIFDELEYNSIKQSIRNLPEMLSNIDDICGQKLRTLSCSCHLNPCVCVQCSVAGSEICYLRSLCQEILGRQPLTAPTCRHQCETIKGGKCGHSHCSGCARKSFPCVASLTCVHDSTLIKLGPKFQMWDSREPPPSSMKLASNFDTSPFECPLKESICKWFVRHWLQKLVMIRAARQKKISKWSKDIHLTPFFVMLLLTAHYQSMLCTECRIRILVETGGLGYCLRTIRNLFVRQVKRANKTIIIWNGRPTHLLLSLECLAVVSSQLAIAGVAKKVCRRKRYIDSIVTLISYITFQILEGGFLISLPNIPNCRLIDSVCEGLWTPLLYFGNEYAIKSLLSQRILQTMNSLSMEYPITLFHVNLLRQVATFKFGLSVWPETKMGNFVLKWGWDLYNNRYQKLLMKVAFRRIQLVTKLCSNIKCKMLRAEIKKYKICSKCKVAMYCSKKCQKYHWNKQHRVYCHDKLQGGNF